LSRLSRILHLRAKNETQYGSVVKSVQSHKKAYSTKHKLNEEWDKTMSFEFFSTGNKVISEAPFRLDVRPDEAPEVTHSRRKAIVMQWLVSFSARDRLGAQFHPTKDAFPDSMDMDIIKTNDPTRWSKLMVDAETDLALNGYPAPVTEQVTAADAAQPFEATAQIPQQRIAEQTTASELPVAA
jgi:membrane-bound lytic murein transglycosylase